MRPRAVFTIVQNEPFFLPLWLNYYGRYFDRADIYVLDHDSDDGSTVGVSASGNLLQVHRAESFDHGWLNATVSAFQAFLLRSYERVLFSEVDEIVAPDPMFYAGLDAYIAHCCEPLVRCTGYEVVHYPGEEPALRPNAPILAQRRYWHRSPQYCKPLLAAEPTTWSIGFHAAAASPDLRPDPRLFLVHLHRVDYALCVARHRQTATRNWNERDVKVGYGFQNRLIDTDEAFKTWYFGGEDNAAREPIPERLRSLL